MKNKQKIILSISFFSLLKFSFKLIIFEKSFIILNLVIAIFSIIFSLSLGIINDEKSFVISYDYYILIFISSLMFIVILRILQFYFNRKVEDKTIYIAVSSQVSKSKYFITQWLVVIFFIFINVFISFIFTNLFYIFFNNFLISELVLRKSLTFFWYSFISCIFLANFILFLLLLSTPQMTMIFSTLILSFSFIANLPLKFIKTKEESSSSILTFNNSQEKTWIYTVSDIYEVLNLEKHINDGEIKYKYLSKALNDFLINNDMVKETFSNKTNVDIRINSFWKFYNLIKSNDESVKIRDTDFISTFYKQDGTTPKELDSWNNKKVSIELWLKNVFIDENSFYNIYLNEEDIDKKNVMEDIINFINDIKKTYMNLQTSFVLLFDDFVFVDVNKSKLKQVENPETRVDFTDEYLKSVYKRFFKYSSGPGSLILSDTKDIESLVTEYLNFPLMIVSRILENYFINYITKFHNITNNYLIKNDTYNEYKSRRKLFNIFTYLNPFFEMWSNYTYYSGFSNNDIWFNPNSDSKIYLEDQQNIFLPYVQYDLETNEENIIDPKLQYKIIKPFIYIFIQLIISIMFFYISFRKFVRNDLK
ncbi:hypothetical protein [Spiroplasma turonicum]|uniref:Transmembrane protein n=1 Tax=Spiroplasma turonicum TaxID=216946 RepID=A0A0K1P701_9MOLU|nr:hypothetical protein [Spiroplasma turonicum]AKU79662.1 transmembrane protein [Spiroplasma turonicum]ALX70682.1 ABC transporter permease [Spiroplasma turonicum]